MCITTFISATTFALISLNPSSTFSGPLLSTPNAAHFNFGSKFKIDPNLPYVSSLPQSISKVTSTLIEIVIGRRADLELAKKIEKKKTVIKYKHELLFLYLYLIH